MGMDIQEQGVPPGDDASSNSKPPATGSSLMERLAASHAAVLEKWQRNFALDLRRPPAALAPKDVSPVTTKFHRP
jgi:hypothetical protein